VSEDREAVRVETAQAHHVQNCPEACLRRLHSRAQAHGTEQSGEAAGGWEGWPASNSPLPHKSLAEAL
jgi:hypothetical protein